MGENFTMESFEFKGFPFKTVVVMDSAFIAVSTVPEGCCTRVLLGLSDGSTSMKIVGGDGIDQVARFVSRHVVDGDGASRHSNLAAWKFPTINSDSPVGAPPLSAQTVPGTSKGVSYYVLAETAHGRISRRGSEMKQGEARIRVTPRPGGKSMQPNYDKPYLKIALMPHGFLHWSTIEDSHLAQSGIGCDQLRNIVCHAVNTLIVLENGAWK